MRNADIIREELENLGGKVSSSQDDYMMFVDDTGRIRIDVYLYNDDMIDFFVSLYGIGKFVTILVSENKIPFNDRKCAWTRIENILNKNRQLIKKYEQYQNTLSFIREKDETDAI